MYTAICFILFLMVFFKLLDIAFKAAWGAFKISIYLIAFPIVVLALIFGGLFAIALPVILIAGAIATFGFGSKIGMVNRDGSADEIV